MSRSLALSTTTRLPFTKCLALLRHSLSRAGFRVLAEIPFDREFEQHVGLGWKRYTVLLVWSPFQAYQAILTDEEAGILLPFHLIVAETPDGTHLASTDIEMLGHLSGQIALELLGGNISRRLQDIYSDLSSQGNGFVGAGRSGEKHA